MKIHTTYIGYLLDIYIHLWSYLIFCPHVWQKMCLSNGGFPFLCIYRELSQVSVKFCICTWFAPNFPQVQYGWEELTEKGSKFAISKWTNTGFPNEQIHFSEPTNTSVETFPNEFPSPRQHLLHPGTMGKSHTQHPNIRQLPIVPQVHSQLPQPTCSWKWHPNTCQLGNPTTSPKNADINRNI